MRVEYHPSVEQDTAEALQRYDAASKKLGQEFQAELRRVVRIAAKKPGRFHLIKAGWRRANLKRFPYHVVYRELADGIRVTFGATSPPSSRFRNGTAVMKSPIEPGFSSEIGVPVHVIQCGWLRFARAWSAE